MLDDKTISKICIVITAVGIVLLIASAGMLEPQVVQISDIDNSFIGNRVAVSGVAESVTVKDGNTFLVLNDGDRISVVMFSVANVTKGANVTVTGKVDFYKTQLEIVADSIK